MAINKKKEELEDDIDLELEEDEDEDESEEQEDGKKVAEEDGSSDEESEGSSDEDGEEKEEVDAEREAIRERRRREKKMKKEKDRRERQQLMEAVSTLKKENEEFKKRFAKSAFDQAGSTIDSQLRQAEEVYSTATRVMEQAVTEGDGKKFAEAKAISDKALNHYNNLAREKNNVKEKEKDFEKGSANKEEEHEILDSNGKRYGIAWAERNKGWFDPNGGNRESKLIHALDVDLYNEGYDPNTKEYWDELTERSKEILPHRFKSSVPAKKQGQRVGGSGDGNQRAASKELNLPKEFVQTLKAAGYWEDEVKRKAAIKNFHANKSAKG